VSRLLDAPLAVLVQSSSAVGKSSLMEAILALLPEEHPVMIFLTTTAIDLDEELLNRCLVLTVDEERAHPARSRQIPHPFPRDRALVSAPAAGAGWPYRCVRPEPVGPERRQAGARSAPGRILPTSITTALGAQHAAAEA
jgi:hypothetical protein